MRRLQIFKFRFPKSPEMAGCRSWEKYGDP